MITYTLYCFNYLLTEIVKIAIMTTLIWWHSQVVRQRSAKPLFSGSSPLATSKTLFAGVAKLADARDLKSLELLVHAGSSPASGTLLLVTFIFKSFSSFFKERLAEFACPDSLLKTAVLYSI